MADITSVNAGLRELALFAGSGGGILGGKLLGWRTVCAVEWEPYPACVLAARQNDGLLAPFPIWDDVRTFDGRPWRGVVDVVSGGFPCQDISVAGKGDGLGGERSGLWSEMARIIGEVRPRYAFVENSPALTSRGLGRVLGDMASLGYDCRWGIVSAADAGAPHRRERIWIVANARGGRRSESESGEVEQSRGAEVECSGSLLAHANGMRELQPEGSKRDQWGWTGNSSEEMADIAGEADRAVHGSEGGSGWWITEPDVGRVAHGVEARMDRLKALGNGQVPQAAALAWRLLA